MTFTVQNAFDWLGYIVVGGPAILVVILGLSSLLSRPLSERVIGMSVQTAIVAGLLAAITILGLMLATDNRHQTLDLGNWVYIMDHSPAASAEGSVVPGHKTNTPASDKPTVTQPPGTALQPDDKGHEEAAHYHFAIKFVFDRLSVPFVILSFVLCGTIGAFANRYMHREPGFNRFFFLYALFVTGMIVTSLAGTIETLFAGWELVGLSSALLVGFYHERPSPVRNGLRVWIVYRISDAALLLAAVALHHLTGEGDFDKFLVSGHWPGGKVNAMPNQVFLVGLLLLLAAMGKSAMVPFSNWLPRAMEGPTPSSAVFYGALSVHLGAFLLLRVSPVLNASPTLSWAVIVVGLVTAIFSAFAGRVQTDIKCDLSYAALTQVGIIFAEIGLGLRYLALIHILGHACFRTLQFLRAPTLLHDYRIMENAIGSRLPKGNGSGRNYISERMRVWFYRFALERGYLDALLTDYVVGPLLRLLHLFDFLERCWTNLLAGGESRESARIPAKPEPFEELL